MKKILLSLTVFFLFAGMHIGNAQTYTISTIAGTGAGGYSGDGGQAAAAQLNSPQQAFADDSGNVYIADASNNRVRKVSTNGIISTIAGNGTAAYSGDGGMATAAEVNYPAGVIKDGLGNIYVSDFYNDRIRKILPGGIISTIAGTGSGSFSGDGGQATAAGITHPVELWPDKKGNLYFADQGDARIRKIDTGGVITTVAGNGIFGYSGDGGPATAAEVSYADGIALDDSSNIYIADQSNQRIRKVSAKTGFISTIAGTGVGGYSGDGGAATAAQVYSPQSVTIDASGNIFVADYFNNRIRMINSSGIITTVAGNGTAGFSGDGGTATAAELRSPIGISIDANGDLYIADQGNSAIRKLTTTPNGLNVISNTGKLSVYPNPNSGKFTIELKATKEKSYVEIYNMLGAKVYRSIVNTAASEIDMGDQAKGVYLLKITTVDGKLIETEKIVIQ